MLAGMRMKALGLVNSEADLERPDIDHSSYYNDSALIRGSLGLRGADHFALYFRFDYVMLNIGR